MKKENVVIINSHMEFFVPDSKMESVKALLFEVCSGAQNTPPQKCETSD